MAIFLQAKTVLTISILTLLVISCDRDSRHLEGHYHATTSRKANHNTHSKPNRDVDSHLGTESFLDFFKNGTYSIYLNQFEQGTYTFSNDTIQLHPENGQSWKIHYLKSEGLGHFRFPNAKEITSLTLVPNNLKKDYPYRPELNKWRVTPDRPLTNNELLEKFQNYAAFMQAYMRWSKNNNLSLKFNRLSGPLQYANNGLMMRKHKDTKSWCDYFFEGDCDRMNILLRKYFDGLIIDWKYTNNRVLMLIDALGQVSQGINIHKEYFPE